MPTTTIKVSLATPDRIRALGENGRQSAESVVAAALDVLERDRFWDAYDDGVALVTADPSAVAHDRAELAAWDATLTDASDD